MELVPKGPESAARYVVRRRERGDAPADDRSFAVVLSLPPTVRGFVAVEPLDMRGSFDALAGAVASMLVVVSVCVSHITLLIEKATGTGLDDEIAEKIVRCLGGS